VTALDPTPLDLPLYLAGEPLRSAERLAVADPYTGGIVGSVPLVGAPALEAAVVAALAAEAHRSTRHARATILERAAALLGQRTEPFARLITAESGLCLRETRYEVGRAIDVLRWAARAALEGDGQVIDCDVTPAEVRRKIVTTREPLRLVAAITPFNHPLNQVAHKLAPAIAVGAPVILKPSEKTPLTAIRFAELLYEAGLPGPWLSVLVGSVPELVEPLIRHPAVELVSFTGSARVGMGLPAVAGYKKLCLELGGNSPLIVLRDADLELAVQLAAEGCLRNSGQRCTAVKRVLVDRPLVPEFTARFVAKVAEYRCGDPFDEATRVGTVIDEAAAITLERRVHAAVAMGARVLHGGARRGALLEPTVIADVPRDAEMVVEESFGPLAPIVAVDGLDDAIAVANGSRFGLACGVVTRDLAAALRVVREVRTGTVNVNQVPGFRVEGSPFGGVKESGLGIKEGVVEAMRFMTTVKTFSLPWA
jgi:aldehyde dehydrogenase (NAD+)